MLKNIIGAVVGAQLAKRSSKVGTTGGAAGGAIAASAIPMVLSRLSVPMLLGVGVIGYVLNRRKRQSSAAPATVVEPRTAATALPEARSEAN